MTDMTAELTRLCAKVEASKTDMVRRRPHERHGRILSALQVKP